MHPVPTSGDSLGLVRWAWSGRLGQTGLVRLKSFNLYRNAKEMKEFG